ncbi:MAG: oxidoreductase [Planctomycetota bacterium]|nr:MAG: oxidoreductase [Planctomycetota bacterium]
MTARTTQDGSSRSGGPLEPEVLARLAARFRGALIGPDHPEYDQARRVYNGMIDRYPRLIARCTDAADVVAAVRFAREQQLLLAVRGGGHNVAGFGTCDGGMVLDLSGMKGIRVDPARRRAWAQPGVTWGELDHATHAFGLAAPGGIISSTGIAGLTLGGGIGHLSRRCGLSCDNLLAADVVTADGRLVTASAEENPSLYWGLRGGGGNFGVVVSFEYQLHPVGTVCGGPIFYPLARAGEVLRLYREFIAQAPEELGAFFAFQIGPDAPFVPEAHRGETMCAIVVCWSGSPERADAVLRPLREVVPPAFEHVEPMPLPALNSAFDPLLPPGLQHYWKADFATEISDRAIAIHERYGPQVPCVESTMHIYPIDGAPQRLGPDQTAFAYRDARFAYVIAAMYPDPAASPANRRWVREYWEALHPHSAGGAYVNFMMDDEGSERVAASYRHNHARLVELKRRWDPDNVFRLNQNIAP